MWNWMGVILTAVVLYVILLLGYTRFGGDSDTPAPEQDWEAYKTNLNPNKPWNADDLQVEFRGSLHEKIYSIFKAAFLLQKVHLYQLATQAYLKLRSIQLPDGSSGDLYDYSEVFRHNWQLLEPYLSERYNQDI